MNKNRLLSLLIPAISSFSLIANQPISVLAEANPTKQIQLIAQENQSFPELMNAGYENLQNSNYQQALFNFNSALQLRPNDQEVIKAVNEAKAYIYDSNMEKGYEATNNREYESALTYFRLAAQQRPDDFYSQKAIENVQKLMDKEANSETNDSSGQNRLVALLIFIFFLLFILIVGMISIIWRLLQINNTIKDNNKEVDKSSEKDTDSLSIPSQDPNINSSHPSSSASTINSPQTTDNITQNTSSTSNSSPNHSNSIAKPLINNQQINNQPSNNPPQERQSPTKHKQDRESNLVQQTREKQSIANNIDDTQKLLNELKSADRIQRGKIVWNLASQADSRAIQPLVNLMLSSNSQEKSLILEALAQIGFNSIKPINQALIIALQDQHGQVRKNALRDITKLYDLMLQIRPIITHATLNDPDHEVREIARWALTKFNQENNNVLSGQNQNQGYEQEINATIIEDTLN